MTAEYWLSENLEKAFSLPEDARDWLLALFNVIQVFDDMADGDFPDRDKLDVAIFDSLVNMPANPFFQEQCHILLPLLSSAILKWKASDTMEREGQADAVSFTWRAGYYEIVLAVVAICHGQEVAMNVCHDVMKLYGEKYETYMQEMKHA